MKKSRSLLSVLLVIILVLASITGCAPAANKANQEAAPAAGEAAPAAAVTAPAVKNPDTMIYATTEQPSTVDPAIAYDPESLVVTSQAYEGLVTYEQGGSQIKPMLAESWESQDNGKIWVFHLRKGVKFHDGEPFNAEAVKASFERMLKINEGPAWMFDMITKVEAVDENTARFTLAYPFVPFLHALAQPAGPAIISPKAITGHEVNGDLAKDWLKQNMAGTGPYRQTAWNIGQDFTMDKFDEYWGGWDGKHVSKIIFKTTPESNTQRLMLENGDADFAESVPRDALTTMSANKDLALEQHNTLNLLGIWLNNQRGALKNKLVRQAIAYAFNYKDAISIYNNMGTKMQGPLPQGMWAHDSSIVPYDTDVEKAKALLDEAGYPGGKDLKFTIQVETGADEYKRIAELFQQNMKEIGIQVDIQVLAWATIKDMLAAPDTASDMFVSGFYPDYMDPDDVLNASYGSKQIGSINQCFYINKEVDKLLDTARQTTDAAVREPMYKEIQQIINGDAPVVWILLMDSNVAKRAWVKGFVYHPLLSYNFYQMYKE
ncbi:MAG TPA: ABC transporter substrate-binding protein [Clostridia bacterium]|nr:ABC transporter substrate-binding protein [Clostridia bacterium]